MKTLMTAKRQAQWLAGTVAILGTLLTIGGPLILAEHYAQNGANWDASSDYAAEQTRRIAGQDSGNASTVTVSIRHGVENS